MAQARRVSDECIFMLLGEIIEHSRTEELFLTPQNEKTADYIEWTLRIINRWQTIFGSTRQY